MLCSWPSLWEFCFYASSFLLILQRKWMRKSGGNCRCIIFQTDATDVTWMIYDRCGLQRVGVVVAAYCEYTGLCPPNQQDQQSLDRFSMKRFLNERVGGLRTPSDKRFAAL